MPNLIIDGNSLTIEKVCAFAFDESIKVSLSDACYKGINKAAQAVERFIQSDSVVYGITTGFGALKNTIIPKDQVGKLQKNILLSHSVGVGPKLDVPTTRAMMLIRANTLARGHSGIKLETLELLLKLLNLGIYPLIPEKGSLGASGDLAPLAHMALPLIGLGEVQFKGDFMPAAEALNRCGLQAINLCAKEGLALTNGTSFMSAMGAILTVKVKKLLKIADLSGSLVLEALNGTLKAFDPRIHALRPHKGQQVTADNFLKILDKSTFVREYDPLNIQDAYTLRCIPQVHGAIRDTVEFCSRVFEIEINSVTDNPLIFFDQDNKAEILSGGNFHGEPLAFAMDYLAIAMTDLGNMIERRIAKLVDESNNQHLLPPFLIKNSGVNSGFMLIQYTAAALASENKVLSHPSSTDSVPSSANVEDHVSMGANACLHARAVLDNLATILSLELLSAAQAIDFRISSTYGNQMLGMGTRKLFQAIREEVPFIENDSQMSTFIEKIQELVAGPILENIFDELIRG